MANFGFNPEDYKDPVNNFEPLPKGEYYVKAIEAEMKDTNAGDGQFIKGVFEVTRGDYENRKIFVNFNIVNKNPDATRIGREQLSQWSRACGKPKATDTDQLLGIEVRAEVGVEPAKGQYGPSNRIFEFKPKDGDFEKVAGGQAPAGTAAVAGDVAKQQPSKPAGTKVAAGAKAKNPWDD